MRAALLALLVSAPALADDDPSYRFVEDAALGADTPLVTKLGDLQPCPQKQFATGSAVFWLEFDKAGKVTGAHVHGSGNAKLEVCLAAALSKSTADKHDTAVVVAGHLDLEDLAPDHRHDYLPSARMSTTPVLFDAHGAAYQMTMTALGYTSNRAQDIGQVLSDKSEAIAKCAAKRTKPGAGLAWYDGHAIVRSGAPGYDSCLAAVLETIKLPAADSALWMRFEVAPPGEPLAAKSDKAMSHADAVKAEVTTAVRSRKAAILDCVGKAGISRVPIVVASGVANLAKTATGDADIDACLRKKLADVKLPSATKTDAFEWSISLEPE